MSVKQLDAVFDKSKSEGAAFQVAIAMADWATDAGWCHPSYSQIQAKAHIKSRATVLAAIEKLVSLDELEVYPRGQAPKAREDDDVPPPSARQFRNLYRLTIIKKKKAEVVQLLNHLDAAEVDQPLNQQSDAEVVQLLNQLDREVDQFPNGGGSTTDLGGSSILDAHIRNSPSVLTVNGPSAAALAEADAADPCEAMRLAWNDAIADANPTSPIPIVTELTATRRRLMLSALREWPIETWEARFHRVAESSFCRGGGRNGWVADLWWLLSESREAALKVDEGKYDDHFSEGELQAAAHEMFNAYGPGRCPHQVACVDHDRCVRRFALALRERRKATA